MRALVAKQPPDSSVPRRSFAIHLNGVPEAKTPPALSTSHIGLQRKPACPCGGGCPRCKDNHIIQSKLKISEPGDKYEQEADRIANQVMRMADDEVKDVSETTTRIQRKCASCASGGELCTECEREEEGLVQRGVQNEDEASAPAIPDDFLQNLGPGKPLDPKTRAYFEPRFGYSFGNVRVHTDSNAARSAQSVNAVAYTLGSDIVFGTEQWKPRTFEGKKLLAHELAHTIHQSGSGRRIQRFVECLPITMAITPDDKRCPDRVSGEINRARTSSMFLWELNNPRGWLVENFAIGSSAIKKNLESNQRWIAFKEEMVKQTDKRWEILGFSDCSGDEGKNKSLRKERALAVFSILPESVQQRIDNAEDAFIGDCIVENRSEIGRSLNRSVFIRISGISFPARDITVQPPKPKPKPKALTVDCHKSEVEQLSRAYPIAIDMAEKALDIMSGGSTPEKNALLEKYFNDSSRGTKRHVYRGFKNLYEGIKTSFKFECEHKGEWFYSHFCKETQDFVRHGYVRPYVGFRVHVCEAAFGHGDKRLAKLIVHECSHMFDFTDDEEYCSSAGCSKSLSRWDAYDNADSYGWFAFEAYDL